MYKQNNYVKLFIVFKKNIIDKKFRLSVILTYYIGYIWSLL